MTRCGVHVVSLRATVGALTADGLVHGGRGVLQVMWDVTETSKWHDINRISTLRSNGSSCLCKSICAMTVDSLIESSDDDAPRSSSEER